jgi:hypothetical protein
MKLRTSCVIVSLILAGAFAASAAEEKVKATTPAPKPRSADWAKTGGQEITIHTGTLIKQKVRRFGQVTNGALNVSVVDHEMIRRLGANNITQALNRSGNR